MLNNFLLDGGGIPPTPKGVGFLPKNIVKVNSILCGNCLEVLQNFPDNLFSAVVTDPPYGLSKQPDMREVLKHWLSGNDYEHSSSGFMGQCYHPDTSVLTDKGFVSISDVKEGDFVCSLNRHTGSIEYVKCVKTHEYDFDGNMIRIKGRSVDQLVTPNHKVYVKTCGNGYELREAQDIPGNIFYMSNQGDWHGRTDETINIGSNVFPTKWFMKFLGMFLGDGYTVNRVAQPEKQDFIGFAVFKDRKREHLCECLKEMGVKYTINEIDNGKMAIYIYNKDLLGYLKLLGKARDKYIPNDLFHYDRKMLDYLYDGMIATDGTIQGNGQQVYYTTSAKLADDFQRLCLCTGRSCVKTWKKNSESSLASECGYCYVLSVVRQGKNFYMGKTCHKNPNVKNWEEEYYCGKVYCVTLERNHILLSRLNGKTVWSGNSWDSFVPGPAIWEEVMRVLKPGGHILSFSGTRTFDLAVTAMRMAGAEIRDKIDYYCQQTGYHSWVYGCLSEDTDVLTSEGWKPGLSVQQGDKVCCVDPACDLLEVEFLPVEETYSYDYNNFAYRVLSEQTDQILSKGHMSLLRHPGCQGLTKHVMVLIDLLFDLGQITIPYMTDDLHFGYSEAKVSMVPYEGTMWCVKVPTGAFVARRNGYAFATGNSGFPKSLNIGKALKKQGAEPEIVEAWEGYGTALKPAHEPIAEFTKAELCPQCEGTDPDCQVCGGEGALPVPIMAAQGEQCAPFVYEAKASKKERNWGCENLFWKIEGDKMVSISRIEYARLRAHNKTDQDKIRIVSGNCHPTVKPLSLCRYLVRLVKMPDYNLVLDPFCGSGSSLVGCILEGSQYVGIDADPMACSIALARTKYATENRQKMLDYFEKKETKKTEGN